MQSKSTHDFRSDKMQYSIFSNVLYFLKLIFKISPLFVILECFWGVIMRLPTRIISVLGVKFVIDAIAEGDDTKKIITAVIVIGVIMLLTEIGNALYREFFFAINREKVSKGLSQMLYNKAVQ